MVTAETGVATTFRFRAAESSTTSVAVVGSWDEWKAQTEMAKTGDMWAVTRSLPPGRFAFKFVTDGKWVTGDLYPVQDDGFGGENNAIVVEEGEEPRMEEPVEENGAAADDDGEATPEEGVAEEEQQLEDDVNKKDSQPEEQGCVVC